MSSSLDRFTVLQRLGAGGMAEVFKCRQTGLGGFEKIVVLKRILPHLVSERSFVEMFLDEARIAANLSHPNVVQTFEITADPQGVPYIVMEYVAGPSLSQVIKRAHEQQRVDFRHLARLIEDAAKGLHHAHQACDANGRPLHIIHRDISPQNILLTLEGSAKVADFGVARAEGRLTHTQSGVVKGKVRFTAPEMLVDPDHCVDPRTDVFSLGVCLYLATTGKTPFNGSTDLKVMEAINKGEYPRPSTQIAGYPEGLERIVQWLLEHDPAKRCPSALACADALRTWLETTPGSSPAELGPWVRSFVDPEGPPPPPLEAFGSRASVLTGALPGVDESLDSIDIVVDGTSIEARASSRRWGLFVILFIVVLAGLAGALGVQQIAEDRKAREDRATFIAEAGREVAEGHFGRAEELLRRAAAVPEPTPEDELRVARLEADLRVARTVAAAQAAIAGGDLEAASALLETVLSLEGNHERAAALAKELRSIQHARAEQQRLAALADAGVAPVADVTPDGGMVERIARRPREPRGQTPTAALSPEQTPTPEGAAPPPPEPLSMTPPVEPEVFEPPPVARPHLPVDVKREHRTPSLLRINATVRAQVFVDGLPVGFTPLDVANAGTATRLVMVWAEGYESLTERIAVTGEEQVSLHFPLRKVE